MGPYRSKTEYEFTRFFRHSLSYFKIRAAQVLNYSAAAVIAIFAFIIEIKAQLVRSAYWGRNNFYRRFLHFVVMVITISATYSGLGSRLNSVQQLSLPQVQAQEFNSSVPDVFSQQGAFFAFSDLSNLAGGVFELYLTKPGDSISSLAKSRNLKPDVIRWANRFAGNIDALEPDKYIQMPLLSGSLYKVTTNESVASILARFQKLNPDLDQATFAEFNVDYILESGQFKPGSTIFLPEIDYIPGVVAGAPKSVSKTTGNGSASGQFISPIQGSSYYVTRGFKPYPGHTGVDFRIPIGTWISSIGNGEIVKFGYHKVQKRWSLGYYVVVKHANGISSLYAHGNGVFNNLFIGKTVKAGERIMQSGNTGNSTGPHLHMSLAINYLDVFGCMSCRVNPQGYVKY